MSSGSEGQRQGVQRFAHAPDGHERGPDWAGEQAGRYGRVTGAGGDDGVGGRQPGRVKPEGGIGNLPGSAKTA